MKPQILVIDDDSKNIFALCALLKSRVFTCLTAQSAKEGIIQLIKNDKICIVLMNMMMPEMNGYEAINHIKAEVKLLNIPIIAVTAQAMTGDREKCLAAGATDYLAKPVDVDLLINKINQQLGNIDKGITNGK